MREGLGWSSDEEKWYTDAAPPVMWRSVRERAFEIVRLFVLTLVAMVLAVGALWSYGVARPWQALGVAGLALFFAACAGAVWLDIEERDAKEVP